MGGAAVPLTPGGPWDQQAFPHRNLAAVPNPAAMKSSTPRSSRLDRSQHRPFFPGVFRMALRRGFFVVGSIFAGPLAAYAQLVGGFSPLPVTDKEAIAAANFAVEAKSKEEKVGLAK